VLVLTDLMMPRMPGDVLARRVRERIPGLPVVAMTGLHADDPRAPDVGSLLARGDLAGLLVKPFNEGQLLAVLSRALEGAAGKPAGVVKN
jgi:CheY-like chemotaxis protein